MTNFIGLSGQYPVCVALWGYLLRHEAVLQLFKGQLDQQDAAWGTAIQLRLKSPSKLPCIIVI